jgi:DNA-binding beta-propeller fold protein YncE
MYIRLQSIACAAALALVPACDLGTVADPGGGPIDGGADQVPPDAPNVITEPEERPAVYRRASLVPLYEITPLGELSRFELFGQAMKTTDFTTQNVAISAETKLLQIADQISSERGGSPINLFKDAESRTRSAGIPFRGNPTDIDLVEIDGVLKAYVPLGGGIGDPGNEVAAVDLNNGTVDRVRVGIHPQRTAVHEPSGLVFVCNQYSNYISIIDARTDDLLTKNGQPLEIASEFYCTDLLLVQRDPSNRGEVDELFLFVANEHRASVLKYQIDIERDGNDDPDDVIVTTPQGGPANQPIAEILGVGRNPYRLSLDETEQKIYVANNRGGELALIDMLSNEVLAYRKLDAPTMDVVNIGNKIYVPTTTPFRGLLNQASTVPAQVAGGAIVVTGLDGQQHESHPGAVFDQTDSYNFEDLRNGIFQIDLNLGQRAEYFTDDNEADDLFAQAQKVLAGAIPWAIGRNEAGTNAYVAMLGSDLVQELEVAESGTFRLSATGRTFVTSELPSAVAVGKDDLFVVTMGGEFLERFDLATGTPRTPIDLGYAAPRYPATTMEAGEYFYATAKWSNDGRKACTSCHVDRFLTDGVGFANGATAPTAFHQVRPNYNLMTTDAYFWNGSFVNNGYGSLAFAAQSRTNCELLLFGLIEGPDSDPAQRVGDPINFTSDANDVLCRPDTNKLENGLPAPLDQDGVDEDFNNDGEVSFLDIAAVIAAQKQTAFAKAGESVQEQLARIGQFDPVNAQANRDAVSRAMDFYGAAELRLPPNPLAQMGELELLSTATEQKLAQGKALFTSAGCAVCHDPDNTRHPFTDGLNHGGGANFMRDFVSTYNSDPRLLEIPGLEQGLPEQLVLASNVEFSKREINTHHPSLDYFMPFCFSVDQCLVFDNPLSVRGSKAEDERLFRLALINLADKDRGFFPGQVVGQPSVNTPSLRGTWLQFNLLRHGLAFSVREAILEPGHPALRDGEKGWAVTLAGQTDVHGATRDLTDAQVEALELYVRSIE